MSKVETLDIVLKRQLNSSARCLVAGTKDLINYKASLPLGLVQGEVLTVQVNKRWTFRKIDNVSGELTNRRIDVSALPIQPLQITPFRKWDPKEHYWGDDNEHLQEWAKPIYDFGKRQEFEMEEIVPGFTPENWDSNPIFQATELMSEGVTWQARELFEDLIEEDFRCLAAYSYLGGMFFDVNVEWAAKYYEIGISIGSMSLGEGFNGLLPWIVMENRPFLRCLHGHGLCAWRNNDFKTAKAVFEKLLWMNPTDNLGARFLIVEVAAGTKWENSEW